MASSWRTPALILAGMIFGVGLTILVLGGRLRAVEEEAQALRHALRNRTVPPVSVADTEVPLPSLHGAPGGPESPNLPKGNGHATQGEAEKPEEVREDSKITHWSVQEQTRLKELNLKYGAYGDPSQYTLRMQVLVRDLLGTRRGERSGAGFMAPESMARSMLRADSPDQWQRDLDELWRMWEDQTRMQGELARAADRLIRGKHVRGDSERGIVAGVVIEGALYLVRRGEDPDLDQLVADLERLNDRRNRMLKD